jgi:lysyl-tRNA synthetase class 2
MVGRQLGARVIGGAAELAGVAYAIVGQPRWGSVLAGAALVLLGHGMVNLRSINTEKFAAAGRLAAVAGGLLAVIGAATALLSPAPGEHRPTLVVAVHEALSRMVGHTISWNSASPVVRAVNDALPVFAALAVLAVLYVVVGPMRDLPEPSDEERRRVGSLSTSSDSDLLAPFTTRLDKRYVFSPDGRAALGYRVAFGVAVAGAGPVGHPDAHHAALTAFLQRCDDRGWRPAMIGASQAVRDLTRPMGMHGLQIGDEAIVEVAPFQLDTPPMRNARQAVKRTRNSGVTTTVHREAQLDARTQHGLQVVAEEWRHGGGELGFAMTLDHLLDGTHGDALLFVAWHEGRPVGFQRYLVCRGGTGLSLDVMPRIRRAPNGVNERLIVEAVEWARAHGVSEVSLNFAAFRELFEAAPTRGRWEVGPRVLHRVVHLLDPFINVESLYRFNAKFHPSWHSRHVLFRSPFDVPFFLAAALRLEFSSRTPSTAPEPTRATLPV